MIRSHISIPLFVMPLFMALAAPALATDGVLEINQTCAVQIGCFTGDTPGYPVTIDGSAGKSYRLTSSLILPDENTNGIDVRAPWVSIDLNGFEIVRSGCEGETRPCLPVSGIGYGVQSAFSPSQDFPGASVTNGSIRGMGADGVRLSRQASVTNLRTASNRGNGIRTSGSSLISSNIVKWNGEDGIVVGQGSVVSGNVVAFSGSSGIDNSSGSGTAVSGNTLLGNGDSGTGWGIDFGFGSSSAYRDNVITGPVTATRGTVNGSGVNAGGNVCNGSLTCP